MSRLQLYNTYTRKKEVFEPLFPPNVGMYVCGPTVSGESHLGHVRPQIVFDVLHRWLRHLGYRVRYVRNITDAGHFEEEGRPPEDKVSAKARLEQLEPMEIVTRYTQMYHDAMDALNVLRPHIEPTATGHIIEQIDMIEKIIEKGYAYVVNGSVYFDVTKFASHYAYGQLSGRKLEELIAGSRVLEGQDEKRHPADFALWKKAPPQHLMRWKSPWGEGFPGWHIECSAMATKYLGAPFDIHGGGMDLIFPHHESEIAQTLIATQHVPARYWVHNNLITINGQKMSKSLNNTIALSQLFSGTHPLLQQAYAPMTVRFFVLQTHYRSTLDFSNEALQAAEKGFHRLMNSWHIIKQMRYDASGSGIDLALDDLLNQEIEQCTAFMNDDLNTAQVIAVLFGWASRIQAWKNKQADLGAIHAHTFERLRNAMELFLFTIFGFKEERHDLSQNYLPEVISILIRWREEARQKGDFATADRLRNELFKAGIRLRDTREGTTWDFVD